MESSNPLTPTATQVTGYQGVLLNVWDYGGGGEAVLLNHFTGGVSRQWDPIIRHWGERFHVIAFDARGHGDSEKPPNKDDYEIIHSGRDLLAVVDALGLETPLNAVGHSAGGTHVAYAEMLRPGTFRRVALIDPIMGPEGTFATKGALAAGARRRRDVFESLDAARTRLVAKQPMSTWHPDAVEAYLAHGLEMRDDGQYALKCPGDIEAWVYELGGAPDVFERLGQLQFEALLLTGDKSHLVPLVKQQHELLPKSEYCVIEQGNHFVPQEQPERVADILEQWLEKT